MNELTQLKEQLRQGAITEAEYRAKKAELLTQCAAAAQKPAKAAEAAESATAEEAVAETVEAVEEPAAEVADSVTEEAAVVEVEAEVVEETAAAQSAPQAGWYPDPAGVPNKLRYWNGTAWTDDYTTLEPQPAESAATPQSEPAAVPQSEPTQASTIPQSAQDAQPAASAQQPAAVETPAAVPLPVVAPIPQQQSQQSAGGPQAPHDASTGSTIPPTSGTSYVAPSAEAPYKPTGKDETLRLVAFIFSLLSTLGCAIFIIPLAWCIPMTVITWKIYKGTKPNTTAFGVCSLLFVSLVSGILLLISQKDR